MNELDIPMILEGIFGLLILVLPAVASWLTRLKVLKEVGELLSALGSAAADGKITKEEIDQILSEYKDVREGLRALLGKEKAPD